MARRIDGYSLDKRFLRPDGELVYASVSTRCVRRSNGMVDHFVTVVQDITERKQAEERIRKLAHHDALTGLPNRELLTDRLLQAVARADRDPPRLESCWWISTCSSVSTTPWAIRLEINCCGRWRRACKNACGRAIPCRARVATNLPSSCPI